jgi:metal-sulfur cluster biosynthetic enzyme
MAVTENDVYNALREVYDPEIPVNIVDLGLVYGVRFKPAMQVASELAPQRSADAQDVEVDMTLTSRGCPSHVSIESSVKRAIEAVEGVQFAHVNWVWEPQWGPERISAAGREKLGIEV